MLCKKINIFISEELKKKFSRKSLTLSDDAYPAKDLTINLTKLIIFTSR